MIAPSLFELTGLSIQVSQPIVSGGVWVGMVTDKLDAYSHIISANVGFDMATIEINGDLPYCEEWFENGLLRDITVYNQAGYIVWQGWVNQVGLSAAGLSITNGPVTNLANRAQIIYSPKDTTVTPPVIGTATWSGVSNNLPSQASYGVWQKVINGGTLLATEAAQVLATYLAENILPETTASLNFDGGNSPRVSLQCLGYGHWLNSYIYSITGAGNTTISTRLPLVLAANPNAVFSTVYSNLAANTFAIPVEENNCKTAMEYIRQLVSIGDVTSARYVFGFYEDRVAYYNAIPTTPAYQYQLSSGSQAVEMYADNSTVYPWDVRPAKWIFITDFLIGRVSSTTAIRDDPRMMFIESLNFTAPFSLQLQGAKVSTLPQRLAQLGLGGMS